MATHKSKPKFGPPAASAPTHYVADLLRDKTILRFNRHYYSWVVLGLLLPAIIGGLVTETPGSGGAGVECENAVRHDNCAPLGTTGGAKWMTSFLQSFR